jgi:hypothetical protein
METRVGMIGPMIRRGAGDGRSERCRDVEIIVNKVNSEEKRGKLVVGIRIGLIFVDRAGDSTHMYEICGLRPYFI